MIPVGVYGGLVVACFTWFIAGLVLGWHLKKWQRK